MAIEEADPRDHETWAGVARMWYNKAADKSPTVGRILHRLAVLARPNIVQQPCYYSKALVNVSAFQNAVGLGNLVMWPVWSTINQSQQKAPCWD